jgi:gluconolactonase
MKRSFVLLLALPVGALAWACSSSSSPSGNNNNGNDSGPGNTVDGTAPQQDGSPQPGVDGSMPMDDGGGGTDGGGNPGVNPIMGIAVGNVLPLAGGIGGGSGFVGGLRYFGGKLYAAEDNDPANATIYTVDLDSGTPTSFRAPAAGAIGMSVDTKKSVLLVAEAYNPGANMGDVARVFSDGGSAVVASTYDGGGGASNTMDSPNDVTTRKLDGMIYATDPAYQSATNTGTQHVYRINPTSGAVVVVDVCSDGCRPNGIAISPDESTMYVGYSYSGGAGTPIIKKFTVDKTTGMPTSGNLSSPTPFVSPAPADIDGFAIDDNGNLYVADKAGVDVYAPNGTHWGTIPIPGNTAGSLEPTSLAFGGSDRKTLYISTYSDIFVVVVGVAGRTE